MTSRGYGSLLRSLEKSVRDPVRIKLTKGEVPKWLNGVMYRNGPGRYVFGDIHYNHLFDGQACVHKFKIANGEVYYSNRLLDTQSYTKTVEQKKLFPNFGTVDSERNIFKRFASLKNPPETNDNVNVSVFPYANKYLYAMTESSRFCELDAADLDIIDTINITDKMPYLKNTLAHPHIENDGSWINMGVAPRAEDGKTYYEFVKYKTGQESTETKSNLRNNIEKIAGIPSSHARGFSYAHSFGLTKNYIVFMEQALVLSYWELVKSLIKNEPRSKALLSDHNQQTKIYLIDRNTGQLVNARYYTDPQFTFHYINCYETADGKEVHVDLCSYDPKYFDVNKFTYDNMTKLYSGKVARAKMLKAIPRRIKIPLGVNSGDQVACEIKDLNPNTVFEFPIINYWKNNGLAYKYVYGANHYQMPYSIVKMNVENPTEMFEMKYTDDEGTFHIPNEPIFVENPEAKSEDDGVLLVMVLNEKRDFLSILDAKKLDEIARVEFPVDVKAAFTFHGFFADNFKFSNLNK